MGFSYDLFAPITSAAAADAVCYEMKMNIGREETQCSVIMLSDEGFIYVYRPPERAIQPAL